MESGTVPAPVRGSGSWPTWIAFVANRIAFPARAKVASRKRVGVVRSDAPFPLAPFSDVPYMRGIGNNVKSCHRMPCLDGNGRDFDGDTEQVGDTVSAGGGAGTWFVVGIIAYAIFEGFGNALGFYLRHNPVLDLSYPRSGWRNGAA